MKGKSFLKSKAATNSALPLIIPRSYHVDLPITDVPSWMKWDCTVKCQVIRSASHWSAGVGTEDSIHQAYCSAIRNSKHYIYMLNSS
ncbi:uncharacterized protein LOC136038657 isoform X2 [Artemia franciscana]|uniref:uncharacterized protein LOC136038657 isoform X2 n=1 Tax=Artemia franciscana TaxID=6661 RepID=UPI0032DB92E2